MNTPMIRRALAVAALAAVLPLQAQAASYVVNTDVPTGSLFMSNTVDSGNWIAERFTVSASTQIDSIAAYLLSSDTSGADIGKTFTIALYGNSTVAGSFTGNGAITVSGGTTTLNSGAGFTAPLTLSGGTITTSVTVSAASFTQTGGTANFNASGFTPAITGTVGAKTLTVASGSGTVASANVAAGTQTLTTGTLALGDGSADA